MARRIASHLMLIDGHLEPNMILTLDDSGRILAIEREENIDRCAGMEFYSGVIIPGMINAHCHLELSYLRGAIEEQTGFAGFAREIGRCRTLYSDEERRRKALNADARMWEEGVQAVADIANDRLVMDIKAKSKIEYSTLFEFFGLQRTSLDEHLQMVQEPRSSITPHSIYSVQDEPMRRICSIGDTPLSLHFLESDDESLLYQGRGSLAEWYERMGWECDFLHYGTPSQRIAESIPSSRRVMLIHACKATAEDVEILDKHFAGTLTWVLCPESNRYISRLKPPVDMLRKMGARIAIGTDSLASARHLSMIDNMRQLGDIALDELAVWATENGAKALGRDTDLGHFAVGKSPGVVLIEGVDLHNHKLTEESFSRRLL